MRGSLVSILLLVTHYLIFMYCLTRLITIHFYYTVCSRPGGVGGGGGHDFLVTERKALLCSVHTHIMTRDQAIPVG